MNKDQTIHIGQNITTIEQRNLWLVFGHIPPDTKENFVTLQNFIIDEVDIEWLNAYNIMKATQYTNYKDASSIIFLPGSFFNRSTALSIFSDFIMRKCK